MNRTFILISTLLFLTCAGYSQIVTECPQNIGFESGTFKSWQCYTGFISSTANGTDPRPAKISVSPSQPSVGQHTLILRGGGTDRFGGFSLNAPNGSDYVIKLGNDQNGRGAEAISYTLNVPSNVEAYSIIFNYAVVLENPNHSFDEQPKFTARVIDLTTGDFTDCGSFEFTAPGFSGGIPGFLRSPSADSVLYKPWSPVMVNLSAYLGHRIRLEFTTNDCSRGRHFGYAYIDFNENCSIPVLGNITCPETNSITLKTIEGMNGYRWFNAETQQALGSGAELVLSPVPRVGTKIGVELIPYPGLGCTQTLYTTITNMYMNVWDPPEKCTFIDITATPITVGNSSDLSYTYWKDKNATIPLTDPRHITLDGTYYIKGTSSSGCVMVLPVQVKLTKLDAIDVLPPETISYPATIDLTRHFVRKSGLVYSYWKDPQATVKLSDSLRVRFSGIYYVKATNGEGCSVVSLIPVTVLLPDFIIPNTFTPNNDGVNDVFTILTADKISIRQFQIFNRWGMIVYSTTDITKYWDGFKGSEQMPVGVYYWILDGDEDLKRFRKSGWVMLAR